MKHIFYNDDIKKAKNIVKDLQGEEYVLLYLLTDEKVMKYYTIYENNKRFFNSMLDELSKMGEFYSSRLKAYSRIKMSSVRTFSDAAKKMIELISDEPRKANAAFIAASIDRKLNDDITVYYLAKIFDEAKVKNKKAKQKTQ